MVIAEYSAVCGPHIWCAVCGNSPAFSARLIDCLRGERSDFQFVLIKLRAINICGE